MEEKIKSIFAGRNEIPLFAVDTGSRNWGVNNEASDYDVKGFYIRSKAQLFDFRYEAKKITVNPEGLDFTCYDFNGFLGLISDNSPTAFEMLRSDLIYLNEIGDFSKFKQEVIEYFDLQALANGFVGYGKGNLKTMEKAKEVDYKMAFLALRPLLYAELLKNDKLPENSMDRLLTQIGKQHPLQGIAMNFMARKKTGMEKDILPSDEAASLLETIRDFAEELEIVKIDKSSQERIDKFLEDYSYDFKSTFYNMK